MNTANAAGGLGQYVLGTFTAAGVSQTFTINSVSFASPLISAIQLRDVTPIPQPGRRRRRGDRRDHAVVRPPAAALIERPRVARATSGPGAMLVLALAARFGAAPGSARRRASTIAGG